jgi:hypothetical protein
VIRIGNQPTIRTRRFRPSLWLRDAALEKAPMPKYVIEREIPGAGDLTAEQLQAVSQKSCNVLRDLGPQIQWVHSYVTNDKIYCVYIAQNEQLVREHAKRGGFPANKVSEVREVIDPTTSEVPTKSRGSVLTPA